MPPVTDPRRKAKEAPRLSTPWFWWFVALSLAACFAVTSWVGIDYLFAFPEKKENHQILEKIGQLPKVPELKGRDAPEGPGLNPIALYSQFTALPEELRTEMNISLKRQCVSGFRAADLMYYVEGDFQILKIRDLNKEDFVTEGFAVLAQATIRPDEFRPSVRYPVLLEYILPAAKLKQKAFYPKDAVISLQKVPAFCAVIHTSTIELDAEPFVVVTALPLTAGVQKTPDGQNIRSRLPETFEIAGQFPLFDYSELDL